MTGNIGGRGKAQTYKNDKLATVVLGICAYLLMLGLRHVRARALLGAVAALLVLAMGLSRVWLGHHWLTDVIAGWLIGLAWLGTVVTGHRVKVTLDRAHRSGEATPAAGARSLRSR